MNTQVAEERLEDSWIPMDETVAPEELDEMIRSREAHTNAVILEGVSSNTKSKQHLIHLLFTTEYMHMSD